MQQRDKSVPHRVLLFFAPALFLVSCGGDSDLTMPRQEGSAFIDSRTGTASTPSPSARKPSGLVLQNPGFEDWQNGLPVSWTTRQGMESAVSRSQQEAVEGWSSACFQPGHYYNALSQGQFLAGRLIAGKVLRMTAKVKCSDANMANIAIAVEDFATFLSDWHPGDGQWHELVVSCRVPAFWVGGMVDCRVCVGNLPKHPIFCDDVVLTVE